MKKKSSDSQPYRAVHLGSVFIWGVTSSTYTFIKYYSKGNSILNIIIS